MPPQLMRIALNSPHDHADRDHTHLHGHAPKNFGFAFAAGTLLNAGLVAAQFLYGIHAHSMALIADAGHNLGDALGLLIAWGAYNLARWEPTERYTYGFRSASILAALVNAAILLIVTGAIVWEAVRRFAEPPPVAAPTVMVVAALAIAVNLVSAWLLRGGARSEHPWRIRAPACRCRRFSRRRCYWGVILLSGWYWVDPVVSLLISGVIVWGTWDLLRNAVNLSVQAVPHGIEPTEVREYFQTLPGVSSVHDLHVWAMSTTETALTCHLVMPQGAPGDEFVHQVCEELNARFRIAHPTIQIEMGDQSCQLAVKRTYPGPFSLISV
jgi:cobalt-zinc-cadmium efflux system protein